VIELVPDSDREETIEEKKARLKEKFLMALMMGPACEIKERIEKVIDEMFEEFGQ